MQLVITALDGSSRTVNLEAARLSIGRAADNDLAYPADPALSRYHLCLEPGPTGWIVKDCGSRNGTVVNSSILDGVHALKAGDRIFAGHLTIDVCDSPSKTNETRTIVRFVRQDTESFRREATIVTNLKEVLGDGARSAADSAISSSRAVKALIRAGQELAGHRPLQQLFEMILDLALSAVEATRGVILIAENGSLDMRASRGDEFAISTAVRDRVIRDRAALLVKDALIDTALRKQESIILQRIRSFMAVPLQTGDHVIGLLYVDNGTLFRPFSQEDLELLTVMANVAGVRIEHGRLLAVEQQEQLTQFEMGQASEIQRDLLPSEAPEIDGYEVAGFNLPCRTVGGDYFDFLHYSDGRLGLFIADVCGKGMPAALMMSSLQARVEMLFETEPAAAAALTTLNRNIARRCPVGRFVTAFYGVLNPDNGELQYANAGHNYPIILRADGEVESLRGAGLVMGLFGDVPYQPYSVSLETGDLLVLYSDGVTEASSLNGTQFGEQGLTNFLAARPSQSCQQILTELVSHVRNWSGAFVFADDFTVVLVRKGHCSSI
jgi:serine phosphatase RsbU (regulator of sigma subunit)/pSer/pThr/pTyr-binding forkhead associated (FHA) protein